MERSNTSYKIIMGLIASIIIIASVSSYFIFSHRQDENKITKKSLYDKVNSACKKGDVVIDFFPQGEGVIAVMCNTGTVGRFGIINSYMVTFAHEAKMK